MILVIVVATPSACVVVYTNDCVRLLVGAGVVVLDFSLPGVVGDDTSVRDETSVVAGVVDATVGVDVETAIAVVCGVVVAA